MTATNLLNRSEIAKLLELMHAYLDRMKPYKNESPDLFTYRRQNDHITVEKLSKMMEESQPAPITAITTRRTSEENNR